MAHFVCLLDWVMGCPGIWLNISGQVCGDLSKGDQHLKWQTEESRLSSPVWAGIIQFVEGLNRRTKRSLPDYLSWDISLLFLDWGLHLQCSWLSGSSLALEAHRQLSWVSSLQTVDCGVLSLHNHMDQFPIVNIISIYLSIYLSIYRHICILIYILLVLLLLRTQTNTSLGCRESFL